MVACEMEMAGEGETRSRRSLFLLPPSLTAYTSTAWYSHHLHLPTAH